MVGMAVPGDGKEDLKTYECSECGARRHATRPPVHCGTEMELVKQQR